MTLLSMFDLSGKTALVSGCRRGIGKAIAVALASAGADVIGVSAQLEADSAVGAEIQALNRRFSGYACDFGDRQALYAFIKQVKADFPVIDILVNNAGIILRKSAVKYGDEDWDRTLEINLTSHFILSRELGKEMTVRGWGKIIFIASILSYQGGILVPAYAASKGAIIQLTRALANEWARKGVQVNAIAPGYIRTEATEVLQEDPERSQSIVDRIPARRWGETKDIQGAAIFLASAASDFINGEVLVVDGGWMGR